MLYSLFKGKYTSALADSIYSTNANLSFAQLQLEFFLPHKCTFNLKGSESGFSPAHLRENMLATKQEMPQSIWF